jgi:hypothetical protein
MINRRLVLGMIAAATTIDASRIAFAKEKHHLNGKDLLGENIKKNGKHKIHTTGKKVDVFAEVNNGKVAAVTAAGMQVKKVKSRQKLAETTPGITLASMQLAQADVYYYGYWVYDDLSDTYIWFPARLRDRRFVLGRVCALGCGSDRASDQASARPALRAANYPRGWQKNIA